MLLTLTLTLSGCAGWIESKIPEEPAPAPPPAEPFELNAFQIDARTEVIGRLRYTRVQGEETLLDIARAYDLGYDEIVSANPDIDPWTPDAGERVLLPTAHVLPDAPRAGVVINLAARRLFYYPPAPKGAPRTVITHPLGVGREGWSTPLGRTQVADKQAAPPWTVPPSIRREHAASGDPLPAVVPAGPDNPLGSHALRLGWPSILIHGTNKPAGIGMRVSHGCIQLYPEDIAPLFAVVPVGTPVTVVDQPYLAGIGPDGLLLEAHTPATAAGSKAGAAAVKQVIEAARARQRPADRVAVDLERAQAVAARRAGYPLPIAVGAPDAAHYLAEMPAAPLLSAPDPAPLPADGDWYVDLGTFKSELGARRLTAMLAHQGPPIPARRLAQGRQYQVLAGPYPTRAAAVAVAKRITRDLDETGKAVRLPQLADATPR
ncbi:MAG: L,D-transpeptidase family protein [Gammaproteobacteria bacterium]|nr:L,D-transpeptidase family protein [Gammaproteobacteria bacterium]